VNDASAVGLGLQIQTSVRVQSLAASAISEYRNQIDRYLYVRVPMSPR